MRKDSRKTTRKRELIELYDATAAIYNGRYSEIQTGKYKYILRLFENNDTVLDLGCGTGLLMNLLSDKVASIVGVDLSSEMLQIASSHFKESGTVGNLIRADADTLPFHNNAFTKVVSVSLLQNMPGPKVTIREAARVLMNGGVIAVTCLKKKYMLSEVRDMIEEGEPKLRVISEWDDGGEDVGVNATKPI